MELKVGFVCDRGLNPRRPVNQDRYLALADRGVFAVFDGVGGQRAGEVASQTAADTVEEALAHSPVGSSSEMIRRAIQFANRDVLELADTDPAYRTMATTVALIHIDGRTATVAHVGDSRVYRLEGGRLFRETIDHTDSNDYIREGLVGSQNPVGAAEGNVINRALGVEREVDVELKSIPLREGTRFLLCSDGIHRHVPDEEIADVLARNSDPQTAADELKRIVFQRGADDNLTAVVVQVGDARPPALSRFAPERGNRIKVELDGNRSRIEQTVNAGGMRKLTYTLIVLVLIAGAFYGGLRAPELVRWVQGPPVDEAPATGNSIDVGMEEFHKGRYREAAAVFAQVTTREPQNHLGWYWLGRSQLELGEYATSAQNLERAGPIVADANLYGAAAYRALGNESKARELLDRYNDEQRKKQRGEQR
jgi:serine/threonine protein phosphatase PrpC